MSLLILGLMFEFPAGLNFTPVNALLQQLQGVSGRVMLRPLLLQEGAAEAGVNPGSQVSLIHF